MRKEKINDLFYLTVALMIFVFAGCNTDTMRVAKPQRGGEASAVLSPSAPAITILQPENSQAPTTATYERDIIPIAAPSKVNTNYSIFDTTNWMVVRDRYTTSLGAHQSDDARSGYTGVQKTAAILRAQSPIMYAGIALIIIALAMSYFQARYPLVFTPGIKVIALTFLTGLCLMILPAMTQNKTILIMALLSGSGIVVAYILAKQFSTQNNSTTANAVVDKTVKTKDK